MEGLEELGPLRDQPIEVWRTAKERLAKAPIRRWKLDQQYERAQAVFQNSKGRRREPVERDVWQARLDRYYADFQRWQFGLIEDRPRKPSWWGKP